MCCEPAPKWEWILSSGCDRDGLSDNKDRILGYDVCHVIH